MSPAVVRFAYAKHKHTEMISSLADARAARARKLEQNLQHTPPFARREQRSYIGDYNTVSRTSDARLHTLDHHALPTTHTLQVVGLARVVFARALGEDEGLHQSRRLVVPTFDHFCVHILRELQQAAASVAAGRAADVDCRVRTAITNSSCTGSGLHWFAVAYTIEPA